MRSRAILAVVLGLAAAPVLSSSSEGPGRGPAVQPTAAHARVGFSLVLQSPRPGALDRYLRGLHDPASPAYRRFLSPTRFGRRFGVSDRAVMRVRRAVRLAGLEPGRMPPQRTRLDVEGPAGAVERFLHVRLRDFRAGSGRRWRAPVGRPRLPRSLARSVAAVAGLDTSERLHPAAIPTGGLKPKDAAAAYNVAPLHRMGLRGQGQTIAIVSFDSFYPEDVAEFDRRVGIEGAPAVEKVPVGGGTRPGPGQGEVNLDIDVIRGLAPRARILDYEAPNNGRGFSALIDRIVEDGRADIVSISWGICELGYDPALRAADTRALQAAVARGISVFVASGDAGAYECQRRDPGDHRLSLSWPAASAHVVAVGGTSLAVREDGTHLAETGWEDVLSNAGGGGGLGTVERRPAWQRGPGVLDERSNGRRQVPDVAAAADDDSGWYVHYGGRDQQVGGTSAAAPFWAGSMVLVRQLASRRGAGRLGFVAPLLYRLAGRGRSPFNDVTRGGNRGYEAERGWDFATGLGSPDVALLARRLTALIGSGG